MTENGKKIFDPTMCFMFFGTWVDAIRALERPEDRSSPAYMLFKAIADYSMFDTEPDFLTEYSSVQMLEPFWVMFSNEIDHSLNRRKAQFSNIAPSNRDREVVTYAAGHPEESYSEIGRVFGMSKSSVGRVIDKHRELYDNLRRGVSERGAVDDSVDGSGSGSDNDTGTGNGNDNDNDTSGTGQDGTERDGTGRSTLSSGLIEYINHPIIKLKEWYNSRMNKLYWATGNKIMREYLSTHNESPLQKYFGDKYGRWITGWDSAKDEPIITYSCFYLPPQMMSDGMDVIPLDYWDEEDLPEDMIAPPQQFNLYQQLNFSGDDDMPF